MLKWALVFFVISFIAGGLGFVGMASATASVAKALFFISLALCVTFLIIALAIGQRISDAFRPGRKP